MPPNLDKSDFTLAGVTVDIFDGHLSIVFDPALAAQDVMDAGCYFVPFVVVPKPNKKKPNKISHTDSFTWMWTPILHTRVAHANTQQKTIH